MFDRASVSNPGSRAVNEDAWAAEQAGNTVCVVVADGLGGQQGGAIASDLGVQSVLASFRQNPALGREALQQHMQAANDAILQHAAKNAGTRSMQTTLVVLISDGWKAIWGHIGDSRLYHLRGGKVISRTRDHSVTQVKVDSGDIGKEEASSDSDRNQLYKAAGMKSSFTPAILNEPIALARGDAFLLCVDGFWDKVFETEIEIDFAKSGNAADWLKTMRRRLIERLRPDSDNYTAVVMRATNPDLALPQALQVAQAVKASPRPARPFPVSARIATTAVLSLSLVLAFIYRPRITTGGHAHSESGQKKKEETTQSSGGPPAAGRETTGGKGETVVTSKGPFVYETVIVPRGMFRMGSEGTAKERKDEAPIHRVTLTHDLEFGKYEVSQGQWAQVMGAASPAHFHGSPDLPVEEVNWRQALEFANAASKLNHLPECYELATPGKEQFKGVSCTGYRLPTEAEWEFAAQSSLADPSLPKQDTHNKTPPRTHVPRKPSAKIEDLFGNLKEWVWDYYAEPYPPDPATDPLGPAAGKGGRGTRGCSWKDVTRCEPARRGSRGQDRPADDVGFRLVRSVEEKPAPRPAGPVTGSGRSGTQTSVTASAATPPAGAAVCLEVYATYKLSDGSVTDGSIKLFTGRRLTFQARTGNLTFDRDLKLYETTVDEQDKRNLQLKLLAPPKTTDSLTLYSALTEPQQKCLKTGAP